MRSRGCHGPLEGHADSGALDRVRRHLRLLAPPGNLPAFYPPAMARLEAAMWRD